MTQKHKNAEYIIAFANGEEVEWKDAGLEGAYDVWKLVTTATTFDYNGRTYRMKPKTITTKGYKRYAWQDSNFEWHVGVLEVSDGPLSRGCVTIDNEWHYHVMEEV